MTCWQPALSRAAACVQLGIGVARQDLVSTATPAAIASGLPLYVPRWATRVAPPGMVVCSRPVAPAASALALGQALDHAHDLALAAESADRHAAADALGQAEQVGLDAEPCSYAPP